MDAAAEEPDTWTRTVCAYCGVGCELEIGVRGRRLVAARPVMGAPVNKGHLCTKGRYGFEFVHAPDRLLQPQARRGGQLRVTTWDAALDQCAAELSRIRDRYGANAIGVLGSSRATNEDNYLAQKFARVVLGTNSVDCCARVCHTPSAKALKSMLGAGAATNSFDDIEAARTIMVVGANPLECHPIVGARIRQQALRGKARLIVIDPRRRIQRVRRAVRPPGACRADWQIICALAARMGRGAQFAYSSPAEVWEEIRRVWPEGAGISYSRLELGGLQWPCFNEADPGTATLHVGHFASGPTAALRPVDYSPTPETTDSEFPFLLTTGRRLHQFNVGNMSRRTANLQLQPTDTLDIAPEDGRRLGLHDGDLARLTSRYGETCLPVRLDPAVQVGQAFASFHDPQVRLNRVTGPYRDAMVGAPEFKVTAVQIGHASD